MEKATETPRPASSSDGGLAFCGKRLVSHWTPDFPEEPGQYWFYGDQYQGQMGCHFWDDAQPIEAKMQLIEVFAVSNGIMGKCDGQFFPATKFNKAAHKQGYVGYFSKATLPDAPDDINSLFG